MTNDLLALTESNRKHFKHAFILLPWFLKNCDTSLRTDKYLAEAAGFPRPYVERQVVGGFCLTYHSSRPETLAAIDSRDWDFIVLQEYSYGPTHYGDEPRTPASFMNAVRTLNARIQQNNAANGWDTRVVLYETWAREPGANPAGRPQPRRPR